MDIKLPVSGSGAIARVEVMDVFEVKVLDFRIRSAFKEGLLEKEGRDWIEAGWVLYIYTRVCVPGR